MNSVPVAASTPVQPLGGGSWPSSQIPVYIKPVGQVSGQASVSAGYARQAVLDAMKTWNFAQKWFIDTYMGGKGTPYTFEETSTPPATTASAVVISFNQTQTSDVWGWTYFQWWWGASGQIYKASATMSLILTFYDGSALAQSQLQAIAASGLGIALGLNNTSFSELDLMNPSAANHGVNIPSTLNLYAVYLLSETSNIHTQPSSPVSLPTNIPYTEAPQTALLAGSWWTVTGTIHYEVVGTGGDEGNYREDDRYTDNYTVVSNDGTTMVVSYFDAGSWTCTATDTVPSAFWVGTCGGQTNSGTFSSQTSYTIDVATLKVTATSSESTKDEVGHPTYILLATNATVGDTAWIYWRVPNSNATGSTITDVLYKVDKLDKINVKGVDVTVRVLTYTGERLGNFWTSRSGQKVYEKGLNTESDFYDTAYGIYMGHTMTGSYTYTDSKGSWTDTITGQERVFDTNLEFKPPQVSITLGSPTVKVPVTVDGTSYAGDKLPMVFTWDVGSTHTLRVDATTAGGPGVRYVFIQWSDGSTDASRSITATESTSLTATFKTQYELNVTSDLGNPQGSGWYDANSTATFSVTSPQPETGLFGSLGGKIVFLAWTGNSTANTATANVIMDGPKTVQAQWSTDNSQPYMILGGVGAIVVVVIMLAFILMRRRRAPTPTPTYQALQPAVPPPAAAMPSPPLAQAPAGKFCINCGASLPEHATFCKKCGTKQE
jgi:hypothetical protein